MSEKTDRPLDSAGSDEDGIASADARRSAADPALTVAGADGADAAAPLARDAARTSNLLLYLGVLVALALVAAAIWAAMR